MLRLHFLFPLVLALGWCQEQQLLESQYDQIRGNMEKMGKLMSRWNRIHSDVYSPVPEKDRAFLDALSKQSSDHAPSIPELNGEDAGKLIEGDIFPTDEDIAELEDRLREAEGGKKEDRPKRAASHILKKNWPTDQPIPYTIADGYDTAQREMIHAALKTFWKHTCIDFVENNAPEPKLVYANLKDCGTLLGDTRTSFKHHVISLGPQCFQMNTIQHETIHALGFDHTQKRPDRADYMTYYNERVIPDPRAYFQFAPMESSEFDNYSIPYEYNSVMHYPSTAGSWNGLPVLVPKNLDYIASVGGDHGPTFNDWKAINIRYNCSARFCPEKLDCLNKGYQNPHNCTQCVCPVFYTGQHCEREKHLFEMSGDINQKLMKTYSNVHSNFIPVEQKDADFSQYHKSLTVFKAPEGRQIRVTIDKLESDDSDNCLRECTKTAVEIVDEDLSLVGKRFCCRDRTGHVIISKSNVVGLQFYSSPGYNLSATVVFELVPSSETSTDGPQTTGSPAPHSTEHPADGSTTPVDERSSTADPTTNVEPENSKGRAVEPVTEETKEESGAPDQTGTTQSTEAPKTTPESVVINK